ncbi:signal peptidase II [Roseobacter sp. HKCCD9010]|uniref:signal peptidase II n=1 Tax=unclassified Roseobacter TaxID=196798 RepID=UPI001491D8D4|nr:MULTISPECIES: signal peptidase II [unclassified Roseobacter]MBF9048603.1 signal peptidase II [Rhodobacterales bacterium HKCCD4356]NNV10602.1 signal peptidase II [Roseobacter sp. HKCCD7357]NNV14787.1 signal peptidase II [Roseobacter sp. HKCCD8768]NNV24246.1 signal peptidase II [Roseobacter sp. HKCCD8192]NNV28503.1 signal peptidase II [Roseobacter sp. HKCCD9061]
MRLVFLAAVFWFAADQLSKWAVVHWMRLDEIGHIAVWPPFLNFHMGWNTGINFGLFAGYEDTTRWILIAVAIAISAWVLWWAKTGLTRPIALIAAGSIVGGALGNALDRVIYGAVADFLNMSCCGIVNPFAFNVADIGIFAGAFGLLFFADNKKITP